jgi:hypothetical protein
MALEAILTPLGGPSMQDPASELRRIPIPRTPVNKDDKKGGRVKIIANSSLLARVVALAD